MDKVLSRNATKVAELEAAIAEQAEAIVKEKEQVVKILDEQNQSIAALEEQVANGGTSEELQALINGIKANTAALKKIYTTPEEATEEQAQG